MAGSICAFSPDVASAIEAGDKQAFYVGLAGTISLWMHLGGSSIHFRKGESMAKCIAPGTPEQRALLAAGCDLYDLMMLAPESRKALLDFLVRDLGAGGPA